MDLNKPPFTEKEIKTLTKSYKSAIKEIKNRLKLIDPDNADTMQDAFLKMRMAEIFTIMEGLKGKSKKWAEKYIPKYAQKGASEVLLQLGLVETIKEAEEIASLSTLRKDLLTRRITATQNDLLRGLDNSHKNLQDKVQSAVSRAYNLLYGSGMNNTSVIRKQTALNLREELAKIGETEIQIVDDKTGTIKRRFKIDDYADIVVRTQAMNTHHEHTIEQAKYLGSNYATISVASATKDACRYHQGRIVKLNREADGDYPYWEDLKATGQIFHPRCRHRLLVLDDINDLSREDHKQAVEQHEIGNRAMEVKTKSGNTATNIKTLEKKINDSPLPRYKDNREKPRSVEERVQAILERNQGRLTPPAQ